MPIHFSFSAYEENEAMSTKTKVSSEPTWYADIELPSFPALTDDVSCDVAIIGGGLTGILSACLLSKEGLAVTLIEKDRIASGATGATTGFLTELIDTDLHSLISIFGLKNTRAILDSHEDAIRLIEKMVNVESIACEFIRTDHLLYANDTKQLTELEKELRAALKLGLPVQREEGVTLGFKNAGCMRLKNQAKFHPLKFLTGVAHAAAEAGAQLYEHTEAVELEKKVSKFVIKTNAGKVRASWVISATYEPFEQPAGLYFKKGMYTSYVAELSVPKDMFLSGLYEDLDNPYHYFRVDALGGLRDRVIIGGEDHRSDIPMDARNNFAALKAYIEACFPEKNFVIKKEWFGPILEPVDGIPFIGPHKDPRLLYAFGFSGNGMTYAAIAAQLFRDYILGEKDGWQKIYTAKRIPTIYSLLVKGRDFAHELAGGALKNTFRFFS